MKLYSENENYKLYHGNMLDMLQIIKLNSIDSIITDPPYELNFMGKGWDNSGIAFQSDTWKKCYEVLKPGGYLLAFGGSRTFHRIACAIEDAGFEIRDTIMWLYGSGFPKSFNIGKQIEAKVLFNDASGRSQKKLKGKKVNASMWTHHWSYKNGKEKNDYSVLSNEKVIDVEYTTELGKKWAGWGTQLKPSFEPIIVARKPIEKTIIDNIIEYGVGGINIDECRVKYLSDNDKKSSLVGFKEGQIQDTNVNFLASPLKKAKTIEELPDGRFPANTILTYDETDFDEVCGGFPNTKTGWKNTDVTRSKENINVDFGVKIGMTGNHYEDSGSASRYFYCAKASKKDRDEGLDEFEEKENTITHGDGFNSSTKLATRQQIETGEVGNRSLRKNTHPTVKPTELMQYLVRLVSPDGATILDCFNGSGSTGKAVMYENRERNKNYKYIGIELTEEYLPIAKARIEYVCNLPIEKDNQLTIFDFIEEE